MPSPFGKKKPPVQQIGRRHGQWRLGARQSESRSIEMSEVLRRITQPSVCAHKE